MMSSLARVQNFGQQRLRHKARHKRHGHRAVGVALASACLLWTSWSAQATDTAYYYLAMRQLTVENSASFIMVKLQSDATYTVAMSGCDEMNVYLRPSDATTINAARAAGELVQLHRALPSQQLSQSAVVCVLDASGSAQ